MRDVALSAAAAALQRDLHATRRMIWGDSKLTARLRHYAQNERRSLILESFPAELAQIKAALA